MKIKNVITTSEEAQPQKQMVRVSIGAEGGGAQDQQVQRSNRSGKAVHLQTKTLVKTALF